MRTLIAYTHDGQGLVVAEPIDQVEGALNAAKRGEGHAFVPFTGPAGTKVYVAADKVLFIREQ